MIRSRETGGGSEAPNSEIIDQYEREKIEQTLRDAKHLVAVIENYLKMIKFCEEQGIKIEGRTSLEKLRYPGEPAGPDNDLTKLLSMFESAQDEITKNLTKEQADQIYEEEIKPEGE